MFRLVGDMETWRDGLRLDSAIGDFPFTTVTTVTTDTTDNKNDCGLTG
jgi:hypothetical protein